jgi:hypothetical protein
MKMKKSFLSGYIFLIVCVYMISSCKTGKNYQRPNVPLPQSFDQTTVTTDTNSIADIPWRNFFTDTVLQQLIDSGIVRNYDLQFALRNINIAQSQVKQASKRRKQFRQGWLRRLRRGILICSCSISSCRKQKKRWHLRSTL